MKRILVFLVSMMFLFSSMPSFAVPTTSIKAAKTTIVTGEITKTNPGVPYNKLMLVVKTTTQTYILTGMTAKLSKYVGYTAKITGVIYKGPQGILMLNVKSYKIVSRYIPTPPSTLKEIATPIATSTSTPTDTPTDIPTPTPTNTSTPTNTLAPTDTPTPVYMPTPNNIIIIKGDLYNYNSDMHKFFLKSEKGIYMLIGNTEGMEKVVGNKVEVIGNIVYTLVATEYPVVSVISYKVYTIPPVTPTVKEISLADNGGYVYINKGDQLKLTLESNATTGYRWSYIEKADSNILLETNYNYEQDPASDGMVGVGGNEVWTYEAVADGTTIINMAYSRPWESVDPAKTFIIKVIVGQSPTTTSTPTPTPTPTSIASSNVHTIISTKINHFKNTSVGVYDKDLSGITTVSWTEGTKSAFFNSKVSVLIGGTVVNYQVELIETITTDSYSINGLFNIIKDGTVIATGVKGEVYGLETQNGSYIKFFSEEAMILIAPIVTERFDF